MKALPCCSWTSQPGHAEDWEPLRWVGGIWGLGCACSGSPFSRAGCLNQCLALGRREEEGPALSEPGWLTGQTPQGFCKELVRSVRDVSSHCPDCSHHSETWEVKLFQGQLSHSFFEVGFQWLRCSELQAEAWRPWPRSETH